ncbi:hypothetical protein M758_6G056600 [Ceratodon purpureus]|nr:hypothetical protein M758_6G056400 [Ceratodon purpureus]KAG0612844.1 hypothetical protein M758_6G056600 [Ceratodon purpureus]
MQTFGFPTRHRVYGAWSGMYIGLPNNTHTHTLPQAPPTLMICNAAGGKHNYVSGGGSCRAGGRGHPERSGGVPDVAAPLVWSETLSWAVRGLAPSRAPSQVWSSVLVTAQPA